MKKNKSKERYKESRWEENYIQRRKRGKKVRIGIKIESMDEKKEVRRDERKIKNKKTAINKVDKKERIQEL